MTPYNPVYSYTYSRIPLLPRFNMKILLPASRTIGTNYITWQPEPSVREALVIRSLTSSQINSVASSADGYVVSGRSLHYIELEEQQLLVRTFVELSIALVSTFLACPVSMILFSKIFRVTNF